MILNPSTGRCVKINGIIGRKLISSPHILIDDRKEIKDKKRYPALDLDTNSDNYVSVNEYLSKVESRGPNEKPGGQFAFFDQRNLGISFLLILIKEQKGPIHRIACIAPFSPCVYKIFSSPPRYYYKEYNNNTCESVTGDRAWIGGGPMNQYSSIIIINTPTNNLSDDGNMHIIIPPNLKDKLNICGTDNKDMVICDLTLLPTDDFNLQSHANVLIFDLNRRIIERFDPHGGSVYETNTNNVKFGKEVKSDATYNQEVIDYQLSKKFKQILPEFKYLGTNETCPYLGPQVKTDAFTGLCVTWSAMYMVLRLLNPQLSPVEITKRMIDGSREVLLNKLLRFQRFAIDTIRNYKGDLRKLKVNK